MAGYLAHRKALQDQIKTIETNLAAELRARRQEEATKLAAIEALSLAQSVQRAKEGAASIGQALAGVWGQVQANVQAQIQSNLQAMEQLKMQAETAGMTESQRTLHELKGRKGFGADMLQQAKRYLDTVDKAKKAQELDQFAKGVKESTRTPWEVYRQQVEKLDEALAASKLTAEEHRRALVAAGTELNGPMPQWQPPTLMRAGSAAAIRYAFEMSPGVRSMQERQPAQIMNKQLEEARTQNRHLKDIADAVKGETLVKIGGR